MEENMKEERWKRIWRQLHYGFEDENGTIKSNAGKIINKWKLQCYTCRWKDE